MKPLQRSRKDNRGSKNSRGFAGCPKVRWSVIVAGAVLTGFLPTSLQAAVFTVTNDANGGAGSLRKAIADANANAGADVITFNVPTASLTGNVVLIQPTTPLPAITQAVTINGAAQTASAAGNTNTKGPEVVLNGSLAGPGADGLIINAANCVVNSLVINGFSANGVLITGTKATANKIKGCYIGTDKLGAAPVSNGSGIRIEAGANNNIIGGTTTASRNIISGNNGDGINVADAGSTLVQGNFIGTTRTGEVALANSRGIFLTSAGSGGNTVGGTVAGSRNIISGNGTAGIVMQCSNNVLQGNRIGTNPGGTAAIPNGFNGVEMSNSSNNTVGGTSAAARNVISGNTFRGIFIGPGAGNVIQGNFIGTTANGASAIANGLGVHIEQGTNNKIGGTASGAGNVISGNTEGGVFLVSTVVGLETKNNLVQGNRIGISATSFSAVANGFNGVQIEGLAIDNTIGGTAAGAGNIIAFNDQAGVKVIGAAVGNQIRRNRIFSNGKLGIDLAGGTEDANGVTDNDNQDPDNGPNRLQNRPVIQSVSVKGDTMTIKGFLNSTPNASFAIEFFRVISTDPSGFGEGNVFVRSIARTTSATGVATFSFSITSNQNSTFIGQFLTATATNTATGNTSEFSRATQIKAAASSPSDGSPSVSAG